MPTKSENILNRLQDTLGITLIAMRWSAHPPWVTVNEALQSNILGIPVVFKKTVQPQVVGGVGGCGITATAVKVVMKNLISIALAAKHPACFRPV